MSISTNLLMDFLNTFFYYILLKFYAGKNLSPISRLLPLGLPGWFVGSGIVWMKKDF